MPPEEVLENIRWRTAQGLARLLRLGSLGGYGTQEAAADAAMLLSPEEALGGGVPDVRADLLAEVAVDVLALLHSPSPAGRAAVASPATEAASGEMAATLELLRKEAGLTLHKRQKEEYLEQRCC